MKFVVNQLKKGDVVDGEIVECIGRTDYLVSFGGDLVRVANESHRRLSVGQTIPLKVLSLKPLGFQLISKGWVG